MDENIVLALFDRFEKSAVSELKYSSGGTILEIRRKDAIVQADDTSMQIASTSGLRSSEPESKTCGENPGMPEVKTASTEKKSDTMIKSPIVGTFYRSASPDAPPFAEIGKKVMKGQKLCIIEAMKMMNALEAEYDCEIVAIQVGNGELVEFDQTLFEVRPL